jgi:hypothetical protein
METKILFRTAAAMLLCCSGYAFAQTKSDNLPPVTITHSSAVDPKVTEAFQSEVHAMDPTWYQLDKKYLVKFMTQDQKNAALYDKNGYQVYHITYGGADNLPKESIDMVYKRYPECKINSAVHVNQEQRSIWIINLEHDGNLILARIENDQLREVEKLRKSDAK